MVWPFLRYLCCCLLKKRKPNYKLGLKRSIRKRLGIKVSKSDALLDEDPYLRLGYGINAYFDVILQLLALMIFCSILVLPILWYSASFEAHQGQTGYFITKYSIGNMGGAHS